MVLYLCPTFSNAQSHVDYSHKITETAIANYRIGLNSGVDGIVKSCIYFAGKYRMKVVCEDLVKLLQTSNNDELCKMALWSLYQIGDHNYCQKLKSILKNHPSKDVKKCYEFLDNLNEFGSQLYFSTK
jgi:hypothetical protein